MKASYFKVVRPITIIFLAIFLLSCSQGKKNDTEQYRVDTAEENRIQSDANGLLVKNDIQGALDLYQKSYSRDQSTQIFTARYVKIIETIKSRADKSFEADELLQAEKTYTILLRNFKSFQDFSRLLTFTKGLLNERIKNCRANIVRKEVQQDLNTGRFQKVINTYRNLNTKYPINRLILSDYTKALNDIQGIAQKATAMKNYAVACKCYMVLLKNYGYFEEFSQQLPFDKESLNESITECRTLLFTKGLNEYRDGNLQDAISTWRSLLAFTPYDKETKQALDTAVVQMKKIQQKR